MAWSSRGDRGIMNFSTPVDGGTLPPSVESALDSSSSSPVVMFSSSAQMAMDESGDGTCFPRNSFAKLQIIEQPQDKFRFRYKSEMMGTHGCILGRNSDRLQKTYPTVKLLNYVGGSAVVRCSLVGVIAAKKEPCPHAHRLIVRVLDKDREEPQEMCVDELNNYTAVFQGMGIVHTAKKHVVEELTKKKKRLLLEEIKGTRENDTCLTVREDLRIREESQSEAKLMNLNVVRLCFEAFYDNGRFMRPICEKVYSSPISNMKSAQTGELKICRIDKHVSSCLGGEDVFILVEKVGKKNIQIRFFELDDEDHEIWEDYGKFTELDVHHQYAVVFRTPRYRDINIEQPVDVFLQLYRPSDKDTSEPIRFTYKPREAVGCKRLRTQISETIPTAVVQGFSHRNEIDFGAQGTNPDLKPFEKVNFTPTSQADLTPESSDLAHVSLPSEKWPDIEKLIQEPSGEHNFSWEGFDSLEKVLTADGVQSYISKRSSGMLDNDMAIDCAALPPRIAPLDEEGLNHKTKNNSSTASNKSASIKLSTSTKIKGLPFSLDTWQRIEDETLDKNVLERILGNITSDGNTSLHRLVSYHHSKILKKLLSFIKKCNLTRYIDSKNDRHETPLHLAILHNETEKVKILLQAGAKPGIKNIKGNNSFHIAVLTNQHSSEDSGSLKNQCLDELLNPINYSCSRILTEDLNETNEAGMTPLHLAVECGDTEAVKSLVGANCDVNRFDDHGGCTALHMALVEGNVQITEILLSQPTVSVDNCNRRGISALKLLHVIKGDNFDILFKLLREKMNISEDELLSRLESDSAEEDGEEDADHSTEELNINKPAEHLRHDPMDVEEKPHQETNYVLAEETMNSISSALDLSEKWKDLASILDLEFLVSTVKEQESPSRALLSYADVNGRLSVKNLRDILLLIGEEDAANEVERTLFLRNRRAVQE